MKDFINNDYVKKQKQLKRKEFIQEVLEGIGLAGVMSILAWLYIFCDIVVK